MTKGKETGDIKNDVRKFLEEKYGTDYTIQPESGNRQGIYGSSLQSRGKQNSNIQQGFKEPTKDLKDSDTFKFKFDEDTWDGGSGDFLYLKE